MAVAITKLGYWRHRCLAEPIRMLLRYLEQDYEEVAYVLGDGPEFDASCWFDVKFTLGYDFPNLPYYEDGDVKLTETLPILSYIAAKNGLKPKDISAAASLDMALHFISDLHTTNWELCYSSKSNFEKNLSPTIVAVQPRFKLLAEFLGEKKFLGGDKPAAADFFMFEMLDRWVRLDRNAIHDFPTLTGFMKHFQELPTLSNYFTDPDSTRNWPLNNKRAYFK